MIQCISFYNYIDDDDDDDDDNDDNDDYYKVNDRI